MAKDLVVHVGLTPVAGSPIQTVQALNQYSSSYCARFVNSNPLIYGTRTFDEDLVLPKDRAEIIEVIHSSKILHLHQSIDLVNNEFGVDFRKLRSEGKILVRQWHSEPDHFERYGFSSPESLAGEGLPWLVLGQYHERYYPQARIVPNIIFSDVDLNSLKHSSYEKVKVVYSPTNRFRAAERRWATKGYYETTQMLNELSQKFDFTFQVIEDRPWLEVMREKSMATMVIDDLVTGSYHRSGLEGLMLGKPTFTHLDCRTASCLSGMVGTLEIPFINTTLRQFPFIFAELFGNSNLLNEISRASRQWFETYYSPKKLISHYINIYDELMDNNGDFKSREIRQSSGFLSAGMFDLLYRLENDPSIQSFQNGI